MCGRSRQVFTVLTISFLQSFGLMINMVEHCDGNRQQLVETEVSGSYDAEDSGSEETTAIEALIQVRRVLYMQGMNQNCEPPLRSNTYNCLL